MTSGGGTSCTSRSKDNWVVFMRLAKPEGGTGTQKGGETYIFADI